MDFPDYGLVLLTPRDISGPGVEMFVFTINGNSGGAVTAAVSLLASQTSREHLYLGKWTGIAAPAAGNFILSWQISQVLSSNVTIMETDQIAAPHTAGLNKNFHSDWNVYPGGNEFRFTVAQNAAGAMSFSGNFWGYRFPKGNVMSL